MWVRSLGREDPLEEGMAIHSSTLAWGISWTEEPGISKTIHGVTKNWTWQKRFGTHTHWHCLQPLQGQQLWLEKKIRSQAVFRGLDGHLCIHDKRVLVSPRHLPLSSPGEPHLFFKVSPTACLVHESAGFPSSCVPRPSMSDTHCGPWSHWAHPCCFYCFIPSSVSSH